MREEGKKAQKNQSLMAFDILTLEYANNPAGEVQKYKDEMGKLNTVYIHSHSF